MSAKDRRAILDSPLATPAIAVALAPARSRNLRLRTCPAARQAARPAAVAQFRSRARPVRYRNPASTARAKPKVARAVFAPAPFEVHPLRTGKRSARLRPLHSTVLQALDR